MIVIRAKSYTNEGPHGLLSSSLISFDFKWVDFSVFNATVLSRPENNHWLVYNANISSFLFHFRS